jgi:hypothetical protein
MSLAQWAPGDRDQTLVVRPFGVDECVSPIQVCAGSRLGSPPRLDIAVEVGFVKGEKLTKPAGEWQKHSVSRPRQSGAVVLRHFRVVHWIFRFALDD